MKISRPLVQILYTELLKARFQNCKAILEELFNVKEKYPQKVY